MVKRRNIKNPKSKKNQKYKMPPKVKRRINALLAAVVLSSGFAIKTNCADVEPAKMEPALSQTTNVEKMCTIGIPNNNATIIVDGETYKIDENSFIIVAEDSAIAYDELGNILHGQINEEDFEEVLQMSEDEMSNYTIYQITAESGVNVRSSGEIKDDNKISTVSHLDYVLGYSKDTPEYDGEWISTLSINNNTIYDGYIREDLLQEVGKIHETNNRNLETSKYMSKTKQVNIQTNATGNVTGIDVSGISADDLRELLQNGLPQSVEASSGNYNTSQFAGTINFVYIKLGASSYKNGDLTIFDYDNYEEQVAVCEELGVPYGFYYYSTSVNVEEAKMELECIKERIGELRKNFDMEYNKLEIVVDVELTDKNDRQYNGDISQQTEAKATLINGIQQADLSDNVLIYGPARVMRDDLDQIIDLEHLRSLLSNPDDVALWLCSPITKNGEFSKNMEKDIAYAEQQGFATAVCQSVLDATVTGRIDIDNMSLEHFQELMGYEKEQSTVTNLDYER